MIMVKQVKVINKVHKTLITDFFKNITKQSNKYITSNNKNNKDGDKSIDDNDNNSIEDDAYKSNDDMSNDDYKMSNYDDTDDNDETDKYKIVNYDDMNNYEMNNYEWHCIICGVSMGCDNPRQFCAKSYCANEYTD